MATLTHTNTIQLQMEQERQMRRQRQQELRELRNVLRAAAEDAIAASKSDESLDLIQLLRGMVASLGEARLIELVVQHRGAILQHALRKLFPDKRHPTESHRGNWDLMQHLRDISASLGEEGLVSLIWRQQGALQSALAKVLPDRARRRVVLQ